MPIRRPAERRRGHSLTSLIDVIFLLLLFFMLSSTFTQFAEIEIISGGGGSPSQGVQQTPPLFLKLQGERLILNGKGLTRDSLTHSVQALSAGEPTLLLITPVGDAVSSQTLVNVLIAVRALKNVDIQVLE